MDNTPDIIVQKLYANIGFFVKHSKYLTNCIQTKIIQCENEYILSIIKPITVCHAYEIFTLIFIEMI